MSEVFKTGKALNIESDTVNGVIKLTITDGETTATIGLGMKEAEKLAAKIQEAAFTYATTPHPRVSGL